MATTWTPCSPAELGDAGRDDGIRCVWKCGDCGARCTRRERGHLDCHTHVNETCPATGARDEHVPPIAGSGRRCMHFTAMTDRETGNNTTRQCVKVVGHDDVHAWTREGEVYWLPDAPREVQEAFAKAIKPKGRHRG